MRLEDQVAPLELARQMREMGFPQETCFGWLKPYEGPARGFPDVITGPNEPWIGALPHFQFAVICAAPTVAEMGEWLPAGCATVQLSKPFSGCDWYAHTKRGDPPQGVIAHDHGATEAEARARLLLALAQSGALDPRGLR